MTDKPGWHAQARRAVLEPLLRAGLMAAALAVPMEALACAPTPQAAAEDFGRAMASCNFSTAWRLLHPADRAASDITVWTSQQLTDALENLGCHERVERVEAEAVTDATTTVARIDTSIPISVLEFQRLRARREFADILIWHELDAALDRARSRIVAEGPGPGRVTITESQTLRRDGPTGPWCPFLDLAEQQRQTEERRRQTEERAAAERAHREREQAAAATAAAAMAAAAERREAARALVRVEGAVRGQGTLGVPGVFGEVVNGSGETLRRVDIVIEFLDARGNVVADKNWSPVRVPSGSPATVASAVDYERPLRPGHRIRWGFRADDVTTAWSGAVRARVVAVEVDPNIPPAAVLPPPTPPAQAQAPVSPARPAPAAAVPARRAPQGSAATPPPEPAAPAPPVASPPVSPPPSTVRGEDRAGAVLSTVERLRQQQALAAGGGASGTTTPLNAGERRAAGERLSECWRVDQGLVGQTDLRVSLLARVDQAGTIRDVRPGPGGVPSDPRGRTLYEQARRALLDPACSPLPVPRARLQAINEIQFTFTPRGVVR